MSPPLLFGVDLSPSADAGADPVAAALYAERAGYDFVSTSDHPVGTQPTFETLTLLTWLAARTQRISVVTRVLGVPFRRPAMLAKAAESLHRLSKGRLVVGLGAGHSDAEIMALGGPPLTPAQKVDGLADAITVIRSAWTQPRVDHSGEIHAVADLCLEPKPDTPIPIWLGTYGPRALAVTGRLADGWIPSHGYQPFERLPQMLERIHAAAHAIDRSPSEVRAIYNVAITVDRLGRSDDQRLSGSVANLVDQLHNYVNVGFTGFNFVLAPSDHAAVAGELLPALREI